ncbi:MAG: hypothetical protein M1363_06210 [Gammaproteobacteria bacterium]|nr:hypothetical protein [Gammaproteobacteria bacterium]
MRLSSRSRGFYLVAMTLLFAGLLVTVLLTVQLTSQLQKQSAATQVAEYAAESVAVIAARDLNFKGITNRAMLANEIVIGQLMGIHTWYDMTRRSMGRIALYTSWIPSVNIVTRNMAMAVDRLRVPMERTMYGLILVQQTTVQMLQLAQFTFHQASLLSTIATATQVVEENDPELELFMFNHQTLLDIEYLWLRMQTRTSAPTDQNDYVRMAMESRDPFSQRRTYRLFDAAPIIYAHKAGGSDVKNLLGRIEWQSVDTFSFHVNAIYRWQEAPMGGGSAFFQQRLPSRGRTPGFGESYRFNRRASAEAGRFGRNLGVGHRIPSFYRLSNSDREPQITLVVRSKQPETAHADNEGEAETFVPVIWGAGRQQLYFSRPQQFWQRRDGRNERANIHNALWQTRAVAIPIWELELLRMQI